MNDTTVVPDKPVKEIKSVILVFYQGGTKLKAATVHTPSELKARLAAAKKAVEDCEIETVNESEEVLEDKLYITRNALMFYSIYTPAVKKPKSDIVIAPANAIR